MTPDSAGSVTRRSGTAIIAVLFTGLVLPQAILGLPVAAATIGTLPTLAILAAAGIVMAFAAAAEAEALVRDGEFRRGGEYFGKLLERYLGARATVAPDLLAALRTSCSVLASYVGISLTMAALTGLPRVLWGVLTIVCVTLLLARGGLNIPYRIGAALGLACLPFLAAIGVIAVVHGGGTLATPDQVDAADFGLVGGIVVMLYISNVYMVGIARESLPVRPDGRDLILGSAIGTTLVTVITGLWLLACSSALAPGQLAGESGTVLGPLADQTGAAVTVLGVVLILLLLGLGIERTSVAVMRLTAERLPERRHRLALLAPIAVCLVGELLLGADAVSFSAIFGVAGVTTNIVLAVALPAMLILAARRRGDLPAGFRVPLLGNPFATSVLVGLAALLLALLATVLADDPLTRAGAVIALLALLATVVLALRSGAFNRQDDRKIEARSPS
jgi:amino acid permease